MSVVTVGELEAGHPNRQRPGHPRPSCRAAGGSAGEAPALPIDRQVAARYGELRARVARRPSSYLWIAATALAHHFTLITADERQAALPLVRSTLVD